MTGITRNQSIALLALVLFMGGVPIVTLIIMTGAGVGERQVQVVVDRINRVCTKAACADEVFFEAKGFQRRLTFPGDSGITKGSTLDVIELCRGKGKDKCSYTKVED